MTLEDRYRKLGFTSSKADPCVCSRYRNNGEFCITTMHTDNVLSASSSKEELDRVLQEFAEKWDLTDTNVFNLLLGLTVKRFKGGDTVIAQTAYFEKVLQYFDLWGLYPLFTSLPLNCQVRICVQPMTSDKTEFMSTKSYRPILGCIIWGSSGTQPDLSFACSALGHVQSNPAPEH